MSTGVEMSRFARFAFRGHFFQHAGFRVARSLSSPGPDGRVKLPARFLADPVFVHGLGVQGMNQSINYPGVIDVSHYIGYGITLIAIHFNHRCKHYRFLSGNHAFRAPSSFSVKMSRFFACFALIVKCIYLYY